MEPFGPKDVTPLPGAEPREDFDVNRKSVEAEGPHGEPALAPVPLESPPDPATGKSTVEAEAFPACGRPPAQARTRTARCLTRRGPRPAPTSARRTTTRRAATSPEA
jgi:hypothetical protein